MGTWWDGDPRTGAGVAVAVVVVVVVASTVAPGSVAFVAGAGACGRRGRTTEDVTRDRCLTGCRTGTCVEGGHCMQRGQQLTWRETEALRGLPLLAAT
jgi:hypothetical protein